MFNRNRRVLRVRNELSRGRGRSAQKQHSDLVRTEFCLVFRHIERPRPVKINAGARMNASHCDEFKGRLRCPDMLFQGGAQGARDERTYADASGRSLTAHLLGQLVFE